MSEYKIPEMELFSSRFELQKMLSMRVADRDVTLVGFVIMGNKEWEYI